MRGFRGHVQVRQAEQAERARARLSALRPRQGWVPRVPEAAGEFAMLGVRAERMDVAPDDVRGASGVAETGRVDDDGDERDVDVGGPDPVGRHRAAGGVVRDRIPLPLRVLAESLPSGVRGAEAGLQRMHAVVIGVVILAGIGIAVVSIGLGRPDVTPVEPAPSNTTVETGTPVAAAAVEHSPGATDVAPDEAPDTVVVHVAGKVTQPGIVELPAGSRVVDAVEAAGGANGGVDLSTLNLARVLVDGEQVAVGVEPVAEPVPTGDVAEPVINLNAATPAELESLPGIGPALAANIIAWRDEHGRFTAIEELQEVSGIGPAKLAALADRVAL